MRFAGLIACQGLLVFFAAQPCVFAQTTRTPAPVISPATGSYSGTQTVTIIDSNSGATIYYTTDGSTPIGSASSIYTGPFQVSATSTVQAIAYSSGSPPSLSVAAVYTLNDVATSLAVSGGDPYSMTCGVAGSPQFSSSGPTGTVTFTDTATAQTLGTASLGTASTVQQFRELSSNLIGAGFNSYQTSIATADFNGDGKLDVITADNKGLYITLGNGDGTFQITTTIANAMVAGVATGDFNGDGKMDIATANTVVTGESVAVYLGNGDGTFQPPVTFAGATNPTGIVAADFGNGKLDLAETDGTDNVVWVLLGNGDGTFQNGVSYPNGSQWGLVAGDFTGDGHPDLALTMYNGSVSVLPGNGDGTFGTPIVTAGVNATSKPVAADFNHDGRLDLALTVSESYVGILLGNGDGTFQYAPSLTTSLPGSYKAIAVADFNGDGIPDLVTTSNVVAVALGKGDGSFSSPIIKQLSSNVLAVNSPDVAVGRFSGHSTPEIAAGITAGYAPPSNIVPAFDVFAVAPYSMGQATLSDVPIGGPSLTHSFQCTYPGDGNYQGGASNFVGKTFTQFPPPVFSLLVNVYNAPQTVSIKAEYSGAAIYYTTDGSTPTENSTKYTGPISVSTTTTFKAIAEYLGFADSPVSEAAYTFASTPSFAPPPGNYSSAQQVTISDATPSATVYYTTDGTAPTVKSKVYNAPVAVNGQTVLQAMAVAPGHLYSVVASGNYIAGKTMPAIALTTSAATAASNSSITLTATVTSPVSTPTGSVTFMDGAAHLGTAQLSAGVATYTTSSLSAGSHSITAVYSGDNAFDPVTSSALTETIGQFIISVTGGSSSSITVAPGGSGTYTLSFAPPNGGVFASAVTFSIAGLPSGATATFSPSSIAAGAGATTVTLTIKIPASAALAPQANPFGPSAVPLALGLILLPLAGVGRRSRLRCSGIVLLVALGAVAMVGGCGGGGGSSSGSGSGGGGGGASPQTYALTVTATSGNVSATQALTLTVQ